MAMCVVRVRDVRMHVPVRRMCMPMAVRTVRHRIVDVVVVAIVVTMGMFMLERCVGMRVRMRFGKVEDDTGEQ